MQLPLQRQSSIPVGPTSQEFETSLNRARSGGSRLEPRIQTQMESAMGADFSRVKVHTDSQADQLSQSIQAKAFTTGNDVFFKQGAYNPDSRGGQELLAHELTHVVQQGAAARTVQRKDDDENEREEAVLGLGDGSRIEDLIEEQQREDNQDENTEKDPEIETIKGSLKTIGKAYKSADNDTLAIEKLQYAFEEDQEILDTLDVPEDMNSKDFDARADILQKEISDLKTKIKESKQPKVTQELTDQLHIKEETQRYLKMFQTSQSTLSDEKKSTNKRVNGAVQAYQEAFKQKTFILVFHKQVTAYREKFKAKTKDLPLGQQLAKRDAKEESQELAKKSTVIADKIKESYDTVKQGKTELVSKDRMAPDFTDSLSSSEKFKKWFKAKGVPKVKEAWYDFWAGFGSSGGKQVKSDTDKRGFMKPLRKTSITAEAKTAWEKIQTEFKAVQSMEVRSKPQLFFDCQVLVFQTFDRVILTSIKRVLRYLKIYATILQTIPVLTAIMEAIKAVLSLISGAVDLLRTAINFIIGAIRSVQALASSPAVTNILAMSATESGIQGFASGIKSIGVVMDEFVDGGQNELFKTKVLGKQLNGPTSDDLVGNGTSSLSSVTKPLTNEVVKSNSKTYKNYGSVVKGDLGKNGKGDQGDFKPHDEVVIKMTSDSIKDVMGKFNLFQSDSKQMDQNLDKGTKELDKTESAVSNNNMSEDQEEAIKDTEEANTTMKTSKSVLKTIKEGISK